MTYNSFFSASIIDPELHRAIVDHPDSILIQKMLCQAFSLTILSEIGHHPDMEQKKSLIKLATETDSWTDLYNQTKKLNKELSQTLIEAVKKLQFIVLNQAE
jgi:hypothetical protein